MNKFEKSYIIYGNENYYDVALMCCKSIREFSKLPIIIYLLNSDLKINLENTQTIRWNCNIEEDENNEMYHSNDSNFYINRKSIKIYKILMQRPQIVKDALQKYSDIVTHIDCDSIVTPFIDRIFNLFDYESKYPYFTEGIYDWMTVGDRGGAISRDDLSTTLEYPLCELFGINQNVRDKYRTTNVFIAGQKCIDFFDEWYWMCNCPKILKNLEWYAPFQEETVANVLLWKYSYLKGLPYVYTNGDDNVIDEVYKKFGFNGNHQYIRKWFKIPKHKEDLLVFHGEKRIDIMEKMLKKLKELSL